LRPWYAVNARDLLEARRQGMRPHGPVVVSTIGGEFGARSVLYVHDDMPAERLDWRMLGKLEVWLWSDPSVKAERTLQLLDGIAHALPRRLVWRFDEHWSAVGLLGTEFEQDTHDVDIGTGYSCRGIGDLAAVHEFHWYPWPLNYTPIERQLCAAALTKHPRGAVLWPN
jgi:hypothetical protein